MLLRGITEFQSRHATSKSRAIYELQESNTRRRMFYRIRNPTSTRLVMFFLSAMGSFVPPNCVSHLEPRWAIQNRGRLKSNARFPVVVCQPAENNQARYFVTKLWWLFCASRNPVATRKPKREKTSPVLSSKQVPSPPGFAATHCIYMSLWLLGLGLRIC